MNDKIKYEAEIDFKELTKSPLRLFGWIYILVTVIILGIGIYYVKNLDVINYNESPQTLLRDSIGVYEEKPMVKGGMMPAVDLNIISSPDLQLISNGQEQYKILCATCHGEKGMGDGVAGAALNPKPRNFLQKDGWTNGQNFAGMYKTIQVGIVQNGMAAYEYLPPDERIGIIHYIRSFGEFPAIDENEIATLDAEFNLSAGIERPNQIPVSLAMNKISSEIKKLADSTAVQKIISENSNDPGFELLIKYSIAPDKVIGIILVKGISGSVDMFSESVSQQPMELGFNSNIYQLNRKEFSDLHRFLLKAYNSNKS